MGNFINNKGASSVAQLSNNEDGMPSSLAAKLEESSCMVSIIISSDNTISVKPFLSINEDTCFLTILSNNLLNTEVSEIGR